MTIGNKQLGFQFKLTGIEDLSFNCLTKQNIKKRIENIVYLKDLPNDSVKLSYVGSNKLNATKNIYIGDRSDSLFENSRKGKVQEVIAFQHPVSVNNKNFIVTQEFKSAASGDIPLYYSHDIEEDYSTIVAESIKVYDKNFVPVGNDKYKIILDQEYNEDTGLPFDPPLYIRYRIANNLKSSFDDSTKDYEIYFVQYTQTIGTIDIVKTKLLSNKLSYREADFEDMWHTMGGNIVKPWYRAYLLLDGLEVKFPTNKKYAIQYEETKKIALKVPTRTSSTAPWFLRIINGDFVSGSSYRYRIPEFENQAFNPVGPYKKAINILCEKIDNTLIKFPHELIQQGSLFSYVDLEIKNNGIIKYAITNNPSKDGSDYLDLDNQRVYDNENNTIKWSSSHLLGVDNYSGIANVDISVKDYYDIFATYSYKEEYFELTSLNLNPFFDASVTNGVRAVYLVPMCTYNNNTGTSGSSRQDASLRWVKVSSSGRIIASNQTGKNNNEKIDFTTDYKDFDGYAIKGVFGLHYSRRANGIVSSTQTITASATLNMQSTASFPFKGWVRFLDSTNNYRYFKYIDKTDVSLKLGSDVPYTCSITENTNLELVNFIDERTTLTNRRATEEEEKTTLPYPVMLSRYFILGEISVNPSHGIKDLVKIDLREDGGGIKEDRYEEAKAKQPETQWLNDYSDYEGQVYPGNASLIIKLPATILETFSEVQIESIIEKHIPFGTKPIIRYYGYAPEIISVLPVE